MHYDVYRTAIFVWLNIGTATVGVANIHHSQHLRSGASTTIRLEYHNVDSPVSAAFMQQICMTRLELGQTPRHVGHSLKQLRERRRQTRKL